MLSSDKPGPNNWMITKVACLVIADLDLSGVTVVFMATELYISHATLVGFW